MSSPAQPADRRDRPLADDVVTLECRHGALSFFRGDDPVGRSLVEFGEWAEREIALLQELVRPDDTVLDVGANVGTHTLPLARRVGPSGRVIAFEPQGPIFDLLAANVARNRLGGVEVRRQGVAGAPGEMRVPHVDYGAHVNTGGVALLARGAPGDAQGDVVPVTSLDALALPRCDLVKLDVEGMEAEVLQGGRGTLLRCAPIVYAECSRIEPGWEVARFVRELGSEVFLHRARAFNPENFFRNPKNTFGIAHETSLLIVPPSRRAEVARIAGAFDLTPIASLDDLARAMLATPRWGDPDLSDVSPLELGHRIEALERATEELRARLDAATAEAVRKETEAGRLERELFTAERRIEELAADLAAREAERARGGVRRLAHGARDALRRLRRRSPRPGPSENERLVARSGLFDAQYYRGRNADLAGLTDDELLRHYVEHGWREGRDPCALFDSSYYLERNADVRAAAVNPLAHYLADGAAEGRNPNPVFDTRSYARHPRVATAGLNPLLHYVRFGAAAGLDPGPTFSTAAYLEQHPEVRASGANPLAHHLAALRSESTPALDPQGLRHYRKAPAPVAPRREEWAPVLARRAARRVAAAPLVDVIVPVYRGYDDTLRCLYTVLTATCKTPHAVVVIDDASPDARLVEELRYLAGEGVIELVQNERNGGFVATCNRGMSLHPDRDVVLLNSDTEVYGDWLDRIRAAALRAPNVGTVTPLSNSATICSYPFFPRDSNVALELEYAELDRLAAEVNAGEAIPLPTSVGFCMYVRRRCLDEVGLFDLERFGRGYGEENDFSLRATRRGWTHVLAPDVFVRHTGGVSFGADRQARIEQALGKLDERFPDYRAAVARFIEEDPPRAARRRLDLARLARLGASEAMLFVVHNRGGGVERHVQELRERLEAEGRAVFFLRPDPRRPDRALLSHPAAWPTPNLEPFDVRGDLEPLAAALRGLRVRHVHVHSLAGFDQLRAVEWVPRLAQRLGAPYDFTVHDYLPICPRINLIDGTGVYCGEPAADACERCLKTSGSPFGEVPYRRWVTGYERLLAGARTVFAPGRDASARIARHFRRVRPTVQGHVEAPPEPAAHATAQPAAGAGARRIAIIGAIGPHKGFEVLRACARDAAERRLPLSFHLVGYSCDDVALKQWGNVSIAGRYEEPDLQRLLAEQRCDCAFFSSVWPETYSYTLSAAITAGLYPIAFDLGVIAERIRDLGWGALIPLTADPVPVNDALLAARPVPPPAAQVVRAVFAECESVVGDYYRLSRG